MKTPDDREASLPAGARRWLSGLSFWLWITGSLALLWLLAGICALHGLKINADELAGSVVKVVENHKTPVALDGVASGASR